MKPAVVYNLGSLNIDRVFRVRQIIGVVQSWECGRG